MSLALCPPISSLLLAIDGVMSLALCPPISSLLLAIDGVMSLALCPPFVMVASPASLSALSFLLTPGDRWCDVLGFVPASLLLAIEGVMSLALCPPLYSWRLKV